MSGYHGNETSDHGVHQNGIDSSKLSNSSESGQPLARGASSKTNKQQSNGTNPVSKKSKKPPVVSAGKGSSVHQHNMPKSTSDSEDDEGTPTSVSIHVICYVLL